MAEMTAEKVAHSPQPWPMPLPYERIDSKRLLRVVQLQDGERLLVRQPFGWHIDGAHIPNAAEQFDRGSVCQAHEWTVVCEFGPHIAIVRDMTLVDQMLAALKLILLSHDATCKGQGCQLSGIDLARAAIAKAEGREE